MTQHPRKFPLSPGALLMIVTLLSLVLANSPFGELYRHFWHSYLPLSIGSVSLNLSLLHWINDGLMAIFFLLVGLEIKRELSEGELSSFRKAMLPVSAALGGMLVPALCFAMFNYTTDTSHGWGIPMATDIAFALAVLSVLKNTVPGSVRIFLTALAIIDDLGAVLVIAIFYTANLSISAFLYAGLLVLLLFGMNRLKVAHKLPFILAGILLWYFVLQSGIHATIAGVLLALFIPVNVVNKRSMLHSMEHALTPVVNYFILPVFALANTALLIDTAVLSQLTSPLALGIMTGLLIGKPIGIALFSKLAVRMGLAELPRQLQFRHIAGAGMLGGIGFTMSIFISMLAFSEVHYQDLSKLAVLISSVVAGICGYLWMKKAGSRIAA